MKVKPFEESGMLFGGFEDENCFLIEKTELYQKHFRPRKISSADFILLRPGQTQKESRLLIIEAKKTLATKGTRRFQNTLSQIANQFMHSLYLALGIWFDGHKNKVKPPNNFAHFFEKGQQVVLVLVIKHRKHDLKFIEDTLKTKYLLKEYKLWRFKVRVINERLAIKEGLVIGE